MRPKSVNEYSNFKRGSDVKTSLDIGEYRVMHAPFTEATTKLLASGNYLLKRIPPMGHKTYAVISMNFSIQKFTIQRFWESEENSLDDFYNDKVTVVELEFPGAYYLSLADFLDKSNTETMQKMRDVKSKLVNEGVQFKRGRDVKTSLDIGHYRVFHAPFTDATTKDLLSGNYLAKRIPPTGHESYAVLNIDFSTQKLIVQNYWQSKEDSLDNFYQDNMEIHELPFRNDLHNSGNYAEFSSFVDFLDKTNIEIIQKIEDVNETFKFKKNSARAKLVNEDVQFKRGTDTKETLKLGGLAAQTFYDLKKRSKYQNLDVKFKNGKLSVKKLAAELHYINNRGDDSIAIVDIFQNIKFLEGLFAVKVETRITSDNNLTRNQEQSDPDLHGITPKALASYIEFQLDSTEEDCIYALLDKDEYDYLDESARFERTGNIKKTLELGHEWLIGYHEGSYMYETEKLRGSYEEVRLEVCKKFLKGFDYAAKMGRSYKIDGVWATFSEWEDKYRNEGAFYRDANNDIKQHEKWVGGWNEDFDKRVRFREVDIIQLRFYDKFVLKKDNND